MIAGFLPLLLYSLSFRLEHLAAMFEGIINSLLEKYLAPYLDNMSSASWLRRGSYRIRAILSLPQTDTTGCLLKTVSNNFEQLISVIMCLAVAFAETNLRFRLGKMSAKNLKLKSDLCALLGFSELELQARRSFQKQVRQMTS